MSQYTMSGT